MKCIVVDDEPLAHRVLEKYISSLSSLELLKTCHNALEALSFLHQNKVDLMFLDIKMPELNGLEFLKTLTFPPQIIITTAYSEYALQGYEFSVVDYLLKPFSFARFLKAVNKVIDKTEEKGTSGSLQETTEDYIFLKEDKINHKVLYSEIRYIEGCGNYIKVYTNQKMLVVAETMTAIEKKLPSKLFTRVHKSYMVSIAKIKQIEGNLVKIGDKGIPIGKFYKMRVNEVLDLRQK
ncbi:response regulator transcription factor [candidate division KSB1 bacterium]|nr:response regulator transcription factor [candidate division KSB1 bacterium]